MSKLLPIITHPNPILRKISEEIGKDDLAKKSFVLLCGDMAKTMIEKDGVGLAAPQIGKNIRLIVIRVKDGVLTMINPQITKKSWAKYVEEEGCLSMPNIFGRVQRHKKVHCSYTDPDGKTKKIEASGMLARVIQHEIDHLDGILFADKAKGLYELQAKQL